MTLPTNNDVANRELSIDDLDAIAGGGLLGWIEDGAKAVAHGAAAGQFRNIQQGENEDDLD